MPRRRIHYLTKQHAMKMYRGSGGMTPRINLGDR